MLWLRVSSILTTLDAMQNLYKANNFKTNGDLEDHEGGSQEKSCCQKGKMKFEGWMGMAVPEMECKNWNYKIWSYY